VSDVHLSVSYHAPISYVGVTRLFVRTVPREFNGSTFWKNILLVLLGIFLHHCSPLHSSSDIAALDSKKVKERRSNGQHPGPTFVLNRPPLCKPGVVGSCRQ